MNTARFRGVWWAVSLLLVAVIWMLSSGSDLLGVPLPHPLDWPPLDWPPLEWAGHALEYLALGFALGRATGRPGLALGLAAWAGTVDEVHQAFVAGRDAGIQDWLADLLGGWIGVRMSAGQGSTPVQRRAAPQSSEAQTLETQLSEAQSLETQSLEAQSLEAQSLEAQSLEAQTSRTKTPGNIR